MRLTTVNANAYGRNFLSLREEYQQHHGRLYDDYRGKTFFGYVDLLGSQPILKVVWPLALKSVICLPSDFGSEHVPDDPPFGASVLYK
jgi:hypothetical protein